MFALVDCNSCYASCEQIFRPDLRGKPVIVLSNNDGCIIARSKEAKSVGIPDLLPFFKVKDIVEENNVQVFSSNFRLYGDISNQVMSTLSDFSPHVEQYSIDEMFLDVSNMEKMVNLEEYAFLIKETLWRNVRMPVGVGVAPTKTLSKLANYAAKHIKDSGVAVLDEPHKWEWLQKRLPTSKVWGVGNKLSDRLLKIGIKSAYDLAKANPKRIRSMTSVNTERTIEELNGVSCLALEQSPEARKEIFVTRSLAEATTSKDVLLEHISKYAVLACERLREQNSVCNSIFVFAQTSEFKENYVSGSLSVNLPYPCTDTRVILSRAKFAINNIFKKGHKYTKCGIGLIDLRDDSFQQEDLFGATQTKRQDKLMSVIDKINKEYGGDILTFGSEGLRGRWVMNQKHLSPSYTSSWDDIPRIKC